MLGFLRTLPLDLEREDGVPTVRGSPQQRARTRHPFESPSRLTTHKPVAHLHTEQSIPESEALPEIRPQHTRPM